MAYENKFESYSYKMYDLTQICILFRMDININTNEF
jgi:hypothetical protein